MLNGHLLGGLRPRDFSAALVERLLSLCEQTADDLQANFLGYFYFLDMGDLRRAGELLELALAQSQELPVGFRAGLLLEATYFYAFHGGDFAKAQVCWQRARGGDIEKQTWLRAEAARAFAQGEYTVAITHAEAGLTWIPHSWDPGGALAEKDWLQAIIDQSRESTDRERRRERDHASLGD